MKTKNLISFFHLVLIVLAYSSPFWLDWKLVLLGIGIYYMQIFIFGGCILTFAQYGKWSESFSSRMLVLLASKFGIKLQTRKIAIFLNFLPAILLVFALLYQIMLKLPVLVKF